MFDTETMVGSVSIPFLDNDEYHSGRTVDVDEAKSREVAEWIQEEALHKVREDRGSPDSRLMSMRLVLTWKPPDAHPKGRTRKPEA